MERYGSMRAFWMDAMISGYVHSFGRNNKKGGNRNVSSAEASSHCQKAGCTILGTRPERPALKQELLQRAGMGSQLVGDGVLGNMFIGSLGERNLDKRPGF